MLTRSFCFLNRGVAEDQERALWGRGVVSWDVLTKYPEEASAVLGASRAGKLAEAVNDARNALAKGDAAWFKSNWPEKESWRLWQGYCTPAQKALVDIETTGLTPGVDQITVIGLADGAPSARVFVAGRPQPGDELLEKFREAIKAYKLIVTYNGAGFDLPFIERQFRDQAFRFELPHADLMFPARAMGLQGGLKDMEKQVGIVRSGEIKDMRGDEAIRLWGQWKNQGDLAAYRKLTTYCKADCENLMEFGDAVYKARWAKMHTPFARDIDFAAVKGQQLSLFG